MVSRSNTLPVCLHLSVLSQLAFDKSVIRDKTVNAGRPAFISDITHLPVTLLQNYWSGVYGTLQGKYHRRRRLLVGSLWTTNQGEWRRRSNNRICKWDSCVVGKCENKTYVLPQTISGWSITAALDGFGDQMINRLVFRRVSDMIFFEAHKQNYLRYLDCATSVDISLEQTLLVMQMVAQDTCPSAIQPSEITRLGFDPKVPSYLRQSMPLPEFRQPTFKQSWECMMNMIEELLHVERLMATGDWIEWKVSRRKILAANHTGFFLGNDPEWQREIAHPPVIDPSEICEGNGPHTWLIACRVDSRLSVMTRIKATVILIVLLEKPYCTNVVIETKLWRC